MLIERLDSEKPMNNKIYRSRTNIMIGGVCGGLGQYLGIDATIVRIFFILLAFGNGIGVLIYLLLWILLPPEGQPRNSSMEDVVRTGAVEITNQARSMGDDLRRAVRNPNPQAGLIAGAALILLGVYFLLQNLHISWLRWLDLAVFWPVLLIVGGVALLLRRPR